MPLGDPRRGGKGAALCNVIAQSRQVYDLVILIKKMKQRLTITLTADDISEPFFIRK